MEGYKHYVRPDTNSIVIHGFSNAFEQPLTDDVQLTGDFGRHFQMQLKDELGQYKYKIVLGQMIERTQSELDAEWNSRPTPPPSELELMRQENQQLNLSIIEVWENIIPLLP